LPYPEEPIHFRTFPDPRLTTGVHFKFIASSCLQPNFPYLPFKGNRIRGFDLLSNYIWPPVSYVPIPPPATTDAPAPVAEQSATSITEEEATEAVASEAASVLEEIVSAEAAIASPAPTVTAVPQTSIVPTEFLLLLGDFVYADVPRYAGDDINAFRTLYRRVYASPSFRKVYERLRMCPSFSQFPPTDIWLSRLQHLR